MAPFSHDAGLRPSGGGTASRPRGDRGAILVSTLVKLVLVIGILVVVVHDGFAIASVQVQVRDDAQQTAQVAHDALQNGGTVAKAYQASVAYAQSQGDTLVKNSFVVAKDGSVTVVVTRTASTLVAWRVSALDKYVSPRIAATANDSKY